MNRVRGEVPLIINGQTHKLCLTLGALAEVESHFGPGQLQELDDRLKTPTTKDIIAILGALLRGGGEDVTDDDIASASINLADASKAIAKTFRLAGLGANADGQNE